MVVSQSSRVSSSKGRAIRTPALLTSSPISPSAPATVPTARSTCSGFPTSAAAPAASIPSARSSATTASTDAAVRAQTPTR